MIRWKISIDNHRDMKKQEYKTEHQELEVKIQ